MVIYYTDRPRTFLLKYKDIGPSEIVLNYRDLFCKNPFKQSCQIRTLTWLPNGDNRIVSLPHFCQSNLFLLAFYLFPNQLRQKRTLQRFNPHPEFRTSFHGKYVHRSGRWDFGHDHKTVQGLYLDCPGPINKSGLYHRLTIVQ